MRLKVGDLIEFPHATNIPRMNKKTIGLILSYCYVGEDFPLVNLKIVVAGGKVIEVCDSFTRLIQEGL